MSEKFEHAMDMLFRAKWNIPQACQHVEWVNAESQWSEMKILFQEYCKTRQPENY